MSTAARHFPWLVADIGGTNARFGLVHAAGAPVDDVVGMKTADSATIEEAARRYLVLIAGRRGAASQPHAAAFAVAAPTDGETASLTNHRWTISRAAAQAALGVDHLLLLNDFEANAFALPRLSPQDVQLIGTTALAPDLPMGIVGPGTGLGVAGLLPSGRGTWVAVRCEGGHVTASAADDFEADLLRLLRVEFDHVSAERILSGLGLPNLYRAVTRLHGRQPLDLDAAAITDRALVNADPDCVATLETFCAMLGSFAGNVALTLGARGGLYVAGGIVPRFVDFFMRSRFRERFEAKGRFQPYLAAIATALVTAPYPAMIGAAHAIETKIAQTP